MYWHVHSIQIKRISGADLLWDIMGFGYQRGMISIDYEMRKTDILMMYFS